VTSPVDALAAISTALDGVTGLRPQVKGGKANPPAAVVELDGFTAPAAMGGSADYRVRVLLLVQAGDFRNSLERIWEFIDPGGTAATSVTVALQSVGSVGSVVFDGPGVIEWDGQSYGGGAFLVEVYG
jgi:hypothetical protein